MFSKILSASYSERLSGKSNHYHDGHQLLYVVHGEAEITVGGKSETVSDGTMVLFSRFEEHSIRIKSEKYKRYSVRISPEAVMEGEQAVLFRCWSTASPDFVIS